MTGAELKHEQVAEALALVLVKTHGYVNAALIHELASMVCAQVASARAAYVERLTKLPQNSELSPALAEEALRNLRNWGEEAA